MTLTMLCFEIQYTDAYSNISYASAVVLFLSEFIVINGGWS